MIISNLTRQRIHDYMKEGKRFDNRGLLDYRELVVETGVSINAEGSARVKLGKTEVIAGIKLGVAEPYTDHEDEGTFITTLELTPTSSSRFEPGPPRIESIEMARIIDRGIRESKFIDFKKLCIKEGEKVWGVMLDIFTMNDGGNLLDAASIAAVAALMDARIPKYDEKTGRVCFGEWTKDKLPLNSMPFLMTFHKIGNKVFLDPVNEEEEASDSRMSIAIADGYVSALQKGNSEPIELKELFEIFEAAENKWKEMHKKVEDIINKAIKK